MRELKSFDVFCLNCMSHDTEVFANPLLDVIFECKLCGKIEKLKEVGAFRAG